MQPIIRRFAPGDAPGVLAVERAIWAESHLSPASVAALAAWPEHAVWIAQAGKQVAGFAWCFVSHTGGRGTEWMVDLLAVEPSHRNRGLGTSLISAAFEGGRGRGAPHSRAIVAETNAPSQRAFTKAGFSAAPECHDLLVRAVPGVPRTTTVPAPRAAASERELAGFELLAVHTLLYHGLWIEPTPACMPGALVAQLPDIEAWAREQGLADMTCLAGPEAPHARAALLDAGFRVENRYRVFTRSC